MCIIVHHGVFNNMITISGQFWVRQIGWGEVGLSGKSTPSKSVPDCDSVSNGEEMTNATKLPENFALRHLLCFCNQAHGFRIPPPRPRSRCWGSSASREQWKLKTSHGIRLACKKESPFPDLKGDYPLPVYRSPGRPIFRLVTQWPFCGMVRLWVTPMDGRYRQ